MSASVSTSRPRPSCRSARRNPQRLGLSRVLRTSWCSVLSDVEPSLLGTWLVKESAKQAPGKVHSICAAMMKLKDVPKDGFEHKLAATVATALMVNQVAPSTTVAVCVLHLLHTGAVGDAAAHAAVRKRLSTIAKGVFRKQAARKVYSHRRACGRSWGQASGWRTGSRSTACPSRPCSGWAKISACPR